MAKLTPSEVAFFLPEIRYRTIELLKERGIRFIELHSIQYQEVFQSRTLRFYAKMVYPAFEDRTPQLRMINFDVDIHYIEDMAIRDPEHFLFFMASRLANYIETDYKTICEQQFVIPPLPPPKELSFPPKGTRVVRIRKRTL